jgi:hypothetical protein
MWRLYYILLCLFPLVLYGQEFSHSGVIYDSEERGVENVEVQLLTRSISSYEITNPTYSNYNYGGGTSVSGCDDCVQGPYNIGFNFTFFGNTYSQFYVSSNGWIGFSAGQTNGYVAQFIPNGGAPKNAILADWEDLFPNTGNMNYYVTGTAPNRVLVFNFNNVPHYGCRSNLHTFQIVLHETTNRIDINFQSKPLCGGNSATLGLTNITGSQVVPVGGKNATLWSITQGTSYRFTPSTVQTEFIFNRSVFTNINGQYNFTSTGLDINNFEFKIHVPAPYTKTQLTNTDGNFPIELILGRTPIKSKHYYGLDVNDDGKITVSDAYLIHQRKNGLISTWGSYPDLRFFSSTEWTTIKNGTTNLKSTITGTQSVTINSPVRGGSTNLYLITTGYRNNNKLFY